MNYSDRFVHKRYKAKFPGRKVAIEQLAIPLKITTNCTVVPEDSRSIARRALVRSAAAFQLFHDTLKRLGVKFGPKDPPEDPFAYALVRVKPRVPQLSRGATAELDR